MFISPSSRPLPSQLSYMHLNTIQLKLLGFLSKSTPFLLKYTLSSGNGIHWNSRNPEVILYSTWSQMISKSCQFYILSIFPVFQALFPSSYYFTLGPTPSFTWPSVTVFLPGSLTRVSTLSNLLFILPPFSYPSTKTLHSLALHMKTLASHPKTHKVPGLDCFSHIPLYLLHLLSKGILHIQSTMSTTPL